jgi:hypothetical protein
MQSMNGFLEYNICNILHEFAELAMSVAVKIY